VEILIVLALTAGIVGLAGRLPDPRRVKRELATTRVERIDDLADGKPAAVRGTVAPIEGAATVYAPISATPCVYALVTFDEVGIGGDFHELGRTDTGCPFLLVGPAANARVIPDHPRIAVPGRSHVLPIALLDHPAGNHPALRLARSVCKRPNYPQTSALRVTEYAVIEGMELTIKGFCTREPDPTAVDEVTGYRAAPRTRPVISGTRRVPLLIG